MKYTHAVELLKEGTLIKKSWTNLWIVAQSFTWYINYEKKEWEVIVPKWFEFDFWSIPRVLRWLFNPTKYLAYLLHDYMYNQLQQYKDDIKLYRHNRYIADWVMAQALSIEGMGDLSISVIMLWVRLFWEMYQKSFWKKEGII